MLSHMLRAALIPANKFTAGLGSATSASSFTFSAVDIGTPHPSRIIAVSIVTSGSVSGTISSVTIGGNAAFQLSQSTAGTLVLGVATLAVQNGSTADIVVNSSVTRANGCAIIVHAVYGKDNATHRNYDFSTFSAGATSRTDNITVVAGEVRIASISLGATRTITWSEVTADGSITSYSGTRSFYAATNSSTVTGTPTLSATWTTNTACQLQSFALR